MVIPHRKLRCDRCAVEERHGQCKTAAQWPSARPASAITATVRAAAPVRRSGTQCQSDVSTLEKRAVSMDQFHRWTAIWIARLTGVATLGLVLALLWELSAPVHAQGSVEWPKVVLTPYVSGLENPIHLTHAGDGSGRVFVVEQRGRIRIVREGLLEAQPFLDIRERVSCCGERGLLSVAFPPDYPGKGHFYVNYTDVSGTTVVARFSITADPDVADAASEQVLLTIPQPYANHNGGQMAFGPGDGYLYIGMGDGGSAGDPQNNAQNPGSLLGKMLRIDVESDDGPYAIPPDNPFVPGSVYRPEIWALGLRNPWRFSFDRGTGELYIGDVGQGEYEEVNFQAASSGGGENYGWRIMEGAHCYENPSCDTAGLVFPVVEYEHSQGCSVTGGVVYRGVKHPRMQGVYFYGDYCSGRIWGLKRSGQEWSSTQLIKTAYRIVSFGQDESGDVYVLDYEGGIYLLGDTVQATPTPSVTMTPTATLTATSTPTVMPSPSQTLPPRPALLLPIIVKQWNSAR